MFNGLSLDDFCYINNIEIQIEQNIGSKIRGFSYYYNGYYYVCLNNRFNVTQLKKTLIHELIHILENHFNCPVEDEKQCEFEVKTIIHGLRLAFSE